MLSYNIPALERNWVLIIYGIAQRYTVIVYQAFEIQKNDLGSSWIESHCDNYSNSKLRNNFQCKISVAYLSTRRYLQSVWKLTHTLQQKSRSFNAYPMSLAEDICSHCNGVRFRVRQPRYYISHSLPYQKVWPQRRVQRRKHQAEHVRVCYH